MTRQQLIKLIKLWRQDLTKAVRSIGKHPDQEDFYTQGRLDMLELVFRYVKELPK
jgi:hypothetical protein